MNAQEIKARIADYKEMIREDEDNIYQRQASIGSINSRFGVPGNTLYGRGTDPTVDFYNERIQSYWRKIDELESKLRKLQNKDIFNW